MNAPVQIVETPKNAARRLAKNSGIFNEGYVLEVLHRYADANGNPLYWRIRAKHPSGKKKWIRPMQWDGKEYSLSEPTFANGKPLYRLEQGWSWKSVPVFVCEGEKACDALNKIGITATTSGGADSADAADWTPLSGCSVVIWPDHDEAGAKYGQAVAAKLTALNCNVRFVDVASLNLPPKGDAADWVAANPNATADDVDRLPVIKPNQQVNEPAVICSTDAEEVVRNLSLLSPIDYDRVRDNEAARLGIRVKTLDEQVRALRRQKDGDRMQGEAALFEAPKPWPSAVSGVTMLGELIQTIKSYLALSEHEAVAVALWIVHAHCFDAFNHTPRLNLKSAEKGSGKTTLLDVISTLTPKSMRLENMTTAVFFRIVDKSSPTCLVDECDAHLRDNEDLRGALNSGHKRGGVIARCEGDSNDVRLFRVFSPVALAGIGDLPGTLHDRSIVINLKRARPGEVKKRFDGRNCHAEDTLCRKLARWGNDHCDALAAAEPVMPEGFFNRAADNWRPLLAIADEIGGGWSVIARDAATALSRVSAEDGESIKVQLLSDIRSIFQNKSRDSLSSSELADELNEMEDRPWPEFNHGKPLTAAKLARLLKPFGVKPRQVFEVGRNLRTYTRESFDDAFGRYLREESGAREAAANESAKSARSHTGQGFEPDLQSARTLDSSTYEKVLRTKQDKGSSTLSTFEAENGRCAPLNAETF